MTKILVINPGSTSTKIALFDGETELWGENIQHAPEELAQFGSIFKQVDMRHQLVVKTVAEHGNTLQELADVVSRGGPIAALKSGAYEVNPDMLQTIQYHPQD
jgi:butyrate kinase